MVFDAQSNNPIISDLFYNWMAGGYPNITPPMAMAAGGWLDLGSSEEHLQRHFGGANPRRAELQRREDSDLATGLGGEVPKNKSMDLPSSG